MDGANTQKLPPHSIDAEMSLIGACLLRPETYYEASALISSEDFYRGSNGVIWEAVSQMMKMGKKLDVITLLAHLADSKKLDDAGGRAEVLAIAVDGIGSINAGAYAERIRELAQRRRIIAAAWSIADHAYTAQADELSGMLQNEVSSVMTRSSASSRKFSQVLEESERTIQEARSRRESGRVHGFQFGLKQLDQLSGGLIGPRLIIVAARPKCGKSALLNMGALNSARQEVGGLIVTIELGADELGIRAMAHESGESVSRIHRGYEKESEAGFSAATLMGDIPLWIDDQTASLDSICAQVVLHKMRHNIAWAAIDHIGLVSCAQKFSSQNDKMGHISWTLKQLAKRLGIPIIALSQLGRTCDRENRRPRPDDLRDSGNLEQDADAIIMLHTPMKERNKLAKPLEIGIPANRMGPAIWLDHTFEFDGRSQRIYLPETSSEDYSSASGGE